MRERSVVVGAAEVVAAVGADELAVVAGEAMAAGGADLAVVIDLQSTRGRVELRKIAGRIGAGEADRTTL
jgi:hypothetical protein